MLETGEQIEARAARHLNIQEQQLRTRFLDQHLRIPDTAGFANNLYPVELTEQAAHFAARGRFVIDDEGSHASTGMRTRAVAVSGRERSSATLARGPKISRSRSAAFRSPVPCPTSAAPTERELTTSSKSIPCSTVASIFTKPPRGRRATPCLIAFSTSVCNSIAGILTAAAPSLTLYSTLSRSSRRSGSSST